jgi:hypothetical protein
MPDESLRYRIRDLCIKLLNYTRGESIKWEETADENTFRLTLDSGIFHIERVPPRVFAPSHGGSGMISTSSGEKYRATLFNRNNTPVETYEQDAAEPGSLLKDLYEEARRSALRPEEVVNSFEKELVNRVGQHGG